VLISKWSESCPKVSRQYLGGGGRRSGKSIFTYSRNHRSELMPLISSDSADEWCCVPVMKSHICGRIRSMRGRATFGPCLLVLSCLPNWTCALLDPEGINVVAGLSYSASELRGRTLVIAANKKIGALCRLRVSLVGAEVAGIPDSTDSYSVGLSRWRWPSSSPEMKRSRGHEHIFPGSLPFPTRTISGVSTLSSRVQRCVVTSYVHEIIIETCLDRHWKDMYRTLTHFRAIPHLGTAYGRHFVTS
jgi:hypothetical protein